MAQCSFDSEDWDFLPWVDQQGPVLICNTHGLECSNGVAYEDDKTGALCAAVIGPGGPDA